MEVDPVRIGELGGQMRTTGDAVALLAPLDRGIDAEAGAAGCALAANLKDAATALNKVITYHAGEYGTYADLCARAAEAYENADAEAAAGFERGVPSAAGAPGTAPSEPGG
ncbi:type VII secretion target [Gordonia aurantiaca]|uniref:type VII secretion target n=1 Tax=Gordonia sp. B21 TaxID=3151852 RepID=UPI003267240E